jgi:hypothetical protein
MTQIEADLLLLKWLVAANIVLNLIILGKVFTL